MAQGLLVNIPKLQSCCLQLIRVNLYHALTTDDILAVFTKGFQKPKREHQLLLKDPSGLQHALWSFPSGTHRCSSTLSSHTTVTCSHYHLGPKHSESVNIAVSLDKHHLQTACTICGVACSTNVHSFIDIYTMRLQAAEQRMQLWRLSEIAPNACSWLHLRNLASLLLCQVWALRTWSAFWRL